jgi:hypothetical protein
MCYSMFELNKILVFHLIVLKDNLTTEEELHCLQCRDMTLRRIDIDNLIKIRSPHLLPIFYRCFVDRIDQEFVYKSLY